MEIIVQSKNSLFQQKFHKKLYHFNRNSQLRSVTQKNDPIGLPESESDNKIRLWLHPKTSDSLRLRLRNPGHNTSVFLVLFFIPARWHAAENRSSTCWIAYWADASSTQSPEKSNGLFMQFPTVTPSSISLWLSIAVVLNRERALQGASINFQGGASPYAPYRMDSLIIKFTNK